VASSYSAPLHPHLSPSPLGVICREETASDIKKNADNKGDLVGLVLFLHGLGWELRQQDAMTLFDGHSMTRKLVVWGESR